MMTREFYVTVQCNAVYQLEQFTASQRNHFLGSRETPVVAHDSTGITAS
jgi:hypothetical protein